MGVREDVINEGMGKEMTIGNRGEKECWGQRDRTKKRRIMEQKGERNQCSEVWAWVRKDTNVEMGGEGDMTIEEKENYGVNGKRNQGRKGRR